LENKKSSIPVTGPVPSSSRKTMEPPPPDGPISPEDDEVGIILEDDTIVESDHDDGDPDPLEDKVALEEEELRKDHKGLDEPPMVPHEAPPVTALHEE
jgi:hypothetical protein